MQKNNEINEKNKNNNIIDEGGNSKINSETLINTENIDDYEEEHEIVEINNVLNDCNKELLALTKITLSKDSYTCTYNKGYHSQEVFICLTCFNENKKAGAICVGCSFTCHKEHDVISIYYKRHVKCDCGNSCFLSQCKLVKEKDYDNSQNIYGHNYEGKYCYCDKEDDESEMIQCLLCEDWYHNAHLKFKEGNYTEENGELICNKCFINDHHNFIRDYSFNELLYAKPLIQSQETATLNRKAKRTFEEAFDTTQYKEIIMCKRMLLNHEEALKNKSICEEIIKEKYDIMISGKILEKILCYCNKCVMYYAKYKLPFIYEDFYSEWCQRVPFEEKINKEINEDSEENKQIIEHINSVNMYSTKEIKALNVEQQMALSMVSNEFYAQLKDYINSLCLNINDKEHLVITTEHINEFLGKFKGHLKK